MSEPVSHLPDIKDSHEIELEFRKRADFDFIKRALPGVILYLLAWPVIFLSTGFYKTEPVASMFFGIMLSGVSIIRLLHGSLAKNYYDSHYHLWHSTLLLLVLSHATAWGILAYAVNLLPEFEPIANYVNIIVLGVATASIQSLNTKVNLARVYVSILLLPALVGTLLSGENFQLCFIALMFWGYLIFVGKRFYREYARAFKIEKALHQKQVELHKLNRTDPLTNTNNRREFDEHIEYLWQQSLQNKNPITLMMLDIDHFKAINDTYGHPVGDQCLVHFANLLGPKVADTGTTLYRIGGEEFAVLANNITQEEAFALAEELRSTLQESVVQVEEQIIKMTTSIGLTTIVAQLPGAFPLFIEVTDKSLYQAKERGRNRTVQSKESQNQKST